MTKSRAKGAYALGNVLSFVVQHWSARRVPVAVVALAMVFSTLTEVIVPVFAGHLVDALAQGPAAHRD